jgi:hypothetical protein
MLTPLWIQKSDLAGACARVCGGAAARRFHAIGEREEDALVPGRGISSQPGSAGDSGGRVGDWETVGVAAGRRRKGKWIGNAQVKKCGGFSQNNRRVGYFGTEGVD